MKKILLLSLSVIIFQNSFSQSFTFTNAGSTGQFGPSQAQVNTAYSSTNLAGNVLSVNGIQYWVVPSTGTYQIDAIGASGGGVNKGMGAHMSGEFFLAGGDTLLILVGQEGFDPADGSSSGGGGTYVVLRDASSTTITANGRPVTPLIIGAGGGANPGVFHVDCNANLTTGGNAGNGVNGSGAGGINGNGGSIAVPSGNNRAGGGGGFLTDGDGTGTCGTGGNESGKSFLNGGEGGIHITCGTAIAGGFGGGGGCTSTGWRGSGAGGGYSGGGGGQTNTNATTHRGGGGGSFNSGNNPADVLASVAGNGSVIINTLSSGAFNDAGAVSIDSPTVFCPGPHNVWATIQNFGGNVITSVTVNWAVDGVVKTPFSFIGTLDTIAGTGSPTAAINLGSFTFTNLAHNVVVWTSMPNGVVDTVAQNDSTFSIIQSNLPPPTGLALGAVLGNQASFSWNPGSAVNSWLWVVMPFGSPPVGVGTAASVPNATALGLTSETAYDIYVREVCPTGDTSAWAGPLFTLTPFLCPQNALCFLPCGASGQLGPSQLDCDAAYLGTPLAGNVTVTGGIQNWTVPGGGLYNIEVLGAQGFGTFGGRGAKMNGDFILNTGDVIKILVGQKGAPPIGAGTNQFGGGGGSFVTDNTNTPLIIAGGGGGSWATAFTAITDASISTTGNTGGGTGSTGGAGGAAGLGGASSISADAGAGLLGDGGGTAGGFAFVNGGNGGIGVTNGGEGGFGGGGGASSWNNRRSGGGGGYSGGGGSHGGTAGIPEGGGGGSFNAGTNQLNQAGIRFNDGVVIVTPLTTGATNDIGAIAIGPTGSFCPGVQNVNATVLNYGVTQVDSFTVNWAINNVLQTPVNVVQLLDTIGGSGSTSFSLVLGTNNFVLSQIYTLDAWTTLPNGMADTVSANDSTSNSILTTVPGVSNLTVNNILDVSAQIGWTELGTALQWELEWGAPGFTLGTGSNLFTMNNPHNLTGLTSNTDYDVYVRSVCGAGDTSSWSGPISFLTTCGLYGSPSFEDFDGPQWSGPGIGSIDQCWNRDNTIAPYWQVDNNGTSSTNTGPAMDVSGTGNYVYLETSGGGVGDSSFLEGPWVDLGAASAPQVVFYYHMFGATMGTMLLQASSNGVNWTTLWFLTGQQHSSDTDPFTKATVPMTGFANDTVKIRFVGVRGTSFSGDMAIDEVKVQQAPTNDLEGSIISGIATGCGLTANETIVVEVINQGANSQNSFDIEYKLNAGPWILGSTITTPHGSGVTINYPVTGVDLSTPGNYCITARVALLNDEDTTNDVTPTVCVQHLIQPVISGFQGDEVCGSGPLNLSVVSTANTIEWYDDPGLTNLVNTGLTYAIANATVTTTYHVIGINSNGCTTQPTQVVGTVSQDPTVAYSWIPTGASVDFTSIITGPHDSVSWDFGDFTGSNVTNPTHVYSTTGTYLVTHTAFNGSCIADTNGAIFVNVGLRSSAFENSILVFPNPSEGEFNLEIPQNGKSVHIELINMEGQVIYSEDVNEFDGVMKKKMELKGLVAGNYVLKIIRGDDVAYKRVTIF